MENMESIHTKDTSVGQEDQEDVENDADTSGSISASYGDLVKDVANAAEEAEDIAVMIEEGKLHKSVIENLVKEYEDNREAPNESFLKNIRLAADIASDESGK